MENPVRQTWAQGAAAPAIGLGPEAGITIGRVHEICGPARRMLAVLIAGRAGGPAIWIGPQHRPEALHPHGCAALIGPERLLRVICRTRTDALWAAEEALRAGVGGCIAVDLDDPPALTPVRRLQLAAEAGGKVATALLLTPDEGGAPGVESRWHAAPDPAGGWQLRRLRARMAPPIALHLPDPGGAPAAAPGARAALAPPMAAAHGRAGG
ncbi:MAG: ImuA family protein [Gemmobacter sp.]|jgi:protein ImuA